MQFYFKIRYCVNTMKHSKISLISQSLFSKVYPTFGILIILVSQWICMILFEDSIPVQANHIHDFKHITNPKTTIIIACEDIRQICLFVVLTPRSKTLKIFRQIW